MKNKYLLKSSINNPQGIICPDNSHVNFYKIDSVFAKITFRQIAGMKTSENSGILSHVKGLNLMSKKSLFADYNDDEAIKKYNQKASAQNLLESKEINEMVLKDQKNKILALSNALHNPPKTTKISPNNINSEFFAKVSEDSNFVERDTNALRDNFSSIKNELGESDCIDKESKDSTLVLVNPYKLREYSFVVPEYISIILSITQKSKIYVYCPLDLRNPLEDSIVNYLFPIIFNTQAKLAAQIPLSIMDYPDFSPQALHHYL